MRCLGMPRDTVSVGDGLGALYGNPPIPSLVSFCHFGLCLCFSSVYILTAI